MAMSEQELIHSNEEMLRNMAKAMGLEIEIKSPQQKKKTQKERKAKKLPKVIGKDDFTTLMGAINTKCPTGLRNRAIFETMYRAGLRVQEVANLTPADVNLKTGQIFVQQGKCSKDRYIPIGPCLMEWLSKYAVERPQSQYFFCTLQGEQLEVRYIRAALERVSNKANVFIQDGAKQKPVNPHSLRHSAATNWLDDGLSIREVQDLLGHEKLNTTMIYTHVSMKGLDAKIKALG